MKIFFKKNDDVIANMFVSIAIVMIFSNLVSVIAVLVDGLITSNYYGRDAYSAIALVGPLVNTLVMFAGFISVGSQVVVAKKIGEGDKKAASATFSLSILIGVICSVICITVTGLFSDIVFRICGITASNNLSIYENMLSYTKGYLIGVPAMMLSLIISPIIIIDNHKKLVTLSASVLCVADIVGDLVNVFIFDAGTYGMGLATSSSYIFQLLFLCSHFLRRDCGFHFTLRPIKLGYLLEIAHGGTPTLVRKFATVLRAFFINRINISVAVSTAALAARGIQEDLSLIMFCTGTGIGSAMLSLTAMLYGANDYQGLKNLFIKMTKFSLLVSGILGTIIFIISKPIVMIYAPSDTEVVEIAVFGIRCLALSLPLDMFCAALMNYFQGIQNLKMVNLMNFGERFCIPILTAIVMSSIWGAKGILASIAVGKVILMVTLVIVLFIRSRGIPKSWREILLLPKEYGGKESDNVYYKIHNMEEVVAVSNDIICFMKEHEIDERRIYMISLFVEELAGNIVKWGKPHGKDEVYVDIRLYVSTDKTYLCFRDLCKAFDPQKYYTEHENSRLEEKFGLQMVMAMAQDVNYTYAFNSNIVTITLPHEKTCNTN